MRPELLAILACPYCQSSQLRYTGAPGAAEQSLRCERCGQIYGFEHNWMDLQRQTIERQRLLGTTLPAQLLSALMLRLPRPLAAAVLLCLRLGGLLLLSGQKPQ